MYTRTAQDYRNMVKKATRFAVSSVPQGDDVDAYFKAHLQQVWNEELPKYHILSIRGKHLSSEKKMNNIELFLFITAAGLITYGRKDVIPFVLQEIPKIGLVNDLAITVFDLLPLPDDIDTQVKVLDWLENHYEQLTWDEAQEVFYLKEVE